MRHKWGKKEKKRKRAFLYQKGLFSENCLKLWHFSHLLHSRKFQIVPNTITHFATCYEEKLRQMQMAQSLVVWLSQGGRKCVTSRTALLH